MSAVIMAAGLVFSMQAVTEPVARAEYLAVMDAEHAKLDANGDGNVTGQEAAAAQTREAQMQVLAANRQIFARLDRDNNGTLTAEEFAALAAQPQPADPAPFMQRLDLDKNGSVTLIEHRRVMAQTFDAIDTDVDGVVTPAEMNAANQRAAAAAQAEAQRQSNGR